MKKILGIVLAFVMLVTVLAIIPAASDVSETDGYYVYAKDANGKALDTEYSSYIPAEDGYSIVTTIDSYIQSELEAIIGFTLFPMLDDSIEAEVKSTKVASEWGIN